MKLSDIIKSSGDAPKAYLVLGCPGSGKSRWISEFLSEEKNNDFYNLNIDNFNDKSNRTITLDYCVDHGKNFIYEGIALREERFSSFLDKVNKKKFDVFIVHVKNSSLKEDSNLNKIENKNVKFIEKFKDKYKTVIEVIY